MISPQCMDEDAEVRQLFSLMQLVVKTCCKSEVCVALL